MAEWQTQDTQNVPSRDMQVQLLLPALMSQNGKGDSQRPRKVTYEEYSSNWEAAFGKVSKKKLKEHKERAERTAAMMIKNINKSK